APDLYRLCVRHLQPAAELQGMSRRVDRGVRARRVPPGRGHAGELAPPRIRRRVRAGSFLWIVNNLYFQYYSLFIFVVSVVVMVAVSYATAPPTPEQVAGLTYGTVTTEDRAQSRASWSGREVIASAVVLVLILAAYLYFRG